MREELFWDRKSDRASPEVVIERAINFGGLDFVEEVQEKYGMETFIQVLKASSKSEQKGGQLLVPEAGPRPKQPDLAGQDLGACSLGG